MALQGNVNDVTPLSGTVAMIPAGYGTGGTTDHSQLSNRDAADQHPIEAITGLREILDEVKAGSKQNALLTVETITIGEAGDIPVTGITLDYNSISLNAGDSMMLAASVSPSNATNNKVLWVSNNTEVATVNNGYVTAVSAGNAVITAYSAENNAIKATCSVTVAAESGGDEPEVTLSRISATYSGGDVVAGTSVNDLTGVVVTAHYSDGTSEPVSGYTLSGTIAEGKNNITVSYGGKTATFTVTGVAESDGTVTVLYRNLDIVQGSLAKVDGTIAAISSGMCVEFPYYEGMVVSTMSNGGWYVNYPPIAVYTNGVYNSVDYTEDSVDGNTAKHYTATLTDYPADSVVRVNIWTGSATIEASDEYLYYSYES